MKTTHRLFVEALQSKAPRIIALLALAVLTLTALTDCKSGNHTTANVDPSGVYALVSVDDKPVPCEVTHGNTRMTIKDGVFTIRADATCQSLMRFSVAGHEDVTREAKATYTRNDAELTMKWEKAGTTVGNVDGNQFTMTNEGMILTYKK